MCLFDLIPNLNRVHDITSIKVIHPLEDNFSYFYLFKYFCLYFVKVDNIAKIENDFPIYLSYYIFSVVSMKIQNSIFAILSSSSISQCSNVRIFLNNLSLKLSLFTVKDGWYLLSLRLFIDVFLLPLKFT